MRAGHLSNSTVLLPHSRSISIAKSATARIVYAVNLILIKLFGLRTKGAASKEEVSLV